MLTLAGTAVYLLGPGWNRMDPATTGALLAHILLGLALTPPAIRWLLRHGRTAGKRAIPLTLCGGLCAGTGCWLCARAALGHSTAPSTVAWWAHLLSGFAALILLAPAGYARLRRSPAGTTQPAAEPAPPARTAGLCLLLLTGLLAAATADYPARDYYRQLTATNATQAGNPLFPAGMRLPPGENAAQTARRWVEQSAAYCAECHRTAYDEWRHSAHHRAGTDPAYRRVRDAFATRQGAGAARWCAGCHTPYSTLIPGNTPLADVAPAVDCVACHATTDTPMRTGNGLFTLQLPATYPYARSQIRWQKQLHAFLLRVRPGPHQRAFWKPEWHGSAEFCGTCHRQSFGVAQNRYRQVRTADTYGEWHSGPYSGRTAAAPGPETPCQTCHFRHEGRTHHASPGANTAQASPEQRPHIETFLQQNRVTLDLFALRREPRRPGQLEEWIAPLDAPLQPARLTPGDRLTLEIVVHNRNIGHAFPTGYTDLREAWLEVSLIDARGRTLRSNGTTGPAEPLPADTHAYRMIPIDRNGQALRDHDLDRMVTTASRRAIPPGGSDIARYDFTLPASGSADPPLAWPLQIHARLRYRALRPDFARRTPGLPPEPPITTLAEARVTLPQEQRPAPGDARTALRFLAYGQGLIAPQGTLDRATAMRAFRIAQTLMPDRPEPYIGMARAFLTEPDFLAARAQLEKALQLSPGHTGAQHLLGIVFRNQGEYERAVQWLRPLAERFPQDSALQFDLGLAYFRQGKYEQAAGAYRRALIADPDFPPAHFQLKRMYQHLRRVPDARREEAIGRYLATEEHTGLLREAYFRAHPHERLAAQPIPRHRLLPHVSPRALPGPQR